MQIPVNWKHRPCCRLQAPPEKQNAWKSDFPLCLITPAVIVSVESQSLAVSASALCTFCFPIHWIEKTDKTTAPIIMTAKAVTVHMTLFLYGAIYSTSFAAAKCFSVLSRFCSDFLCNALNKISKRTRAQIAIFSGAD